MNWLALSYGSMGDPRRGALHLRMVDFAKHMAGRGDVVYVAVPRRMIFAGQVEEIPNVEYVGVDPGKVFWEESVRVPLVLGELFSRQIGSYPVDAVFTPKIGAVTALHGTLQHDVGDVVPILDYVPGMADLLTQFGGRESQAGATMLQLVALGMAQSIPMFLQQDEMDQAVALARSILAPSLVSKIIQNAHVSPSGMDFARLDRLLSVPKNDELTVFYGSRIDANKGSKRTFDLVKRVYASGRRFAYWVVTSTPEEVVRNQMLDRSGEAPRPVAIDDLERVWFRSGVGRDEYLEIAARTHVALYWAENEGFGVSYWEQMYLGTIVIFPNRPWVRATLPAGYPFIFETDEEAYALLSYVLDDYETAKAEFDAAMPRAVIRDKLDAEAVWGRVRGRVDGAVSAAAARFGVTGAEHDQIYAPALDRLGDGFTLDQLTREMSRTGRCWPLDPVLRGRWHRVSTNYVVHCQLVRDGFEVTELRGKHPVYSRSTRVDEGA